jgi:formylglycine-generating enzyme
VKTSLTIPSTPLVRVALLLAAFVADARAVTINWSPVGNPGNAADTTVMSDGTSGYGAVPYAYNIGTYDVTNNQYVEFLNAKDASGLNSLNLYNTSMAATPYGGISYNAGNSNGTKYSVISGDGNHPVAMITWYSAIRFANWLNNGQGNGDTESGAYTLLHDGSPKPSPVPSNSNSIVRQSGATVFLPNENEWYKAAFYNPATSSYFQFATSSNTPPIGSSPTALPNHANIRPLGPTVPTDVGAYSGTTSPYGAFDMAGNVFQWNETYILFSRGWRGGAYNLFSDVLTSSSRFGVDPLSEPLSGGFRLASIPEPSSLALAALAFSAFVAYGLKTRKRRSSRANPPSSLLSEG